MDSSCAAATPTSKPASPDPPPTPSPASTVPPSRPSSRPLPTVPHCSLVFWSARHLHLDTVRPPLPRPRRHRPGRRDGTSEASWTHRQRHEPSPIELLSPDRSAARLAALGVVCPRTVRHGSPRSLGSLRLSCTSCLALDTRFVLLARSMPRPAPAILPDIGPGPYRRPGSHPGPAGAFLALSLSLALTAWKLMLRPQSPTAVRVDTHTTITSRVSFADQLQPGGRAFLRSCEVRRSLSLSLYPQPRADFVFSAAVDDQAPTYDGQLGELRSRCATSSRGKALTLRCTVTHASMLAVARLHTIDIELVNEERHVHLVHLVRPLLARSSCSSSQPSRSRPADEVRTVAQVNGFGGMRLVTSFVTFFLDHLVPPSVAHHVVRKPRLLPGRPFYFAADSGDGGPDDPLRVVLPAACIPAYRSPRGWLARSDGRTAREPGMEMLAAPTAVHVSGGPDGETRLGRMWEAGRLGWHGPPTPFEIVSASRASSSPSQAVSRARSSDRTLSSQHSFSPP